jgi:hypothetical protein
LLEGKRDCFRFTLAQADWEAVLFNPYSLISWIRGGQQSFNIPLLYELAGKRIIAASDRAWVVDTPRKLRRPNSVIYAPTAPPEGFPRCASTLMLANRVRRIHGHS